MLNFSAGLAMSASPAHTYSLSLIGAQKNTLPGPAGSCTSASISQEPGAPVYQGPGGRWPAAPRCWALTSLQVGDWATRWRVASHSSLDGHGEQFVISRCLYPPLPREPSLAQPAFL